MIPFPVRCDRAGCDEPPVWIAVAIGAHQTFIAGYCDKHAVEVEPDALTIHIGD